jgi:hypothetical protein
MNGVNMPSTDSRRRLEVPLDIYAALTQIAAERHMPTAALAAVWLFDRLQQERPDIRLNPNIYRYRAMHDRRTDAKTYTWGPPMPRMPYFNALEEREEVITDPE